MRSNYKDLLKVEPTDTNGTRVTKVTKKPYGYLVKLFNNYVTIYSVKLIINTDNSAKAVVKVDKNYLAPFQYTVHYDTDCKLII